MLTVTDDQILRAWSTLAREEGVFCEPSSAAGVAGIELAGLPRGTRVVCVITGHGLKDPESATTHAAPAVSCRCRPGRDRGGCG